jgi:hypothetical protein
LQCQGAGAGDGDIVLIVVCPSLKGDGVAVAWTAPGVYRGAEIVIICARAVKTIDINR